LFLEFHFQFSFVQDILFQVYSIFNMHLAWFDTNAISNPTAK